VRIFGAGLLATAGPKTFTVETMHQIEVDTAANAGGTGRVTMLVYYILP